LDLAVRSYRIAGSILDGDVTKDAGFHFWLAVERVGVWLEDASKAAACIVDDNRYDHSLRYDEMSRVLRVPRRSFSRLNTLRKRSGYGNAGAGKRPRTIAFHETLEAREIANQVFCAVLRHGELLEPQQKQALERRLDAPVIGIVGAAWLEMIERAVMLGHHGGIEDDQLDRLIECHRYPQDPEEYRRVGLIALLAAHRAMNQGQFRLSIKWAKRALRHYDGVDDPFRIAHLHRIQSIAFRHLGYYEWAWHHQAIAIEAASRHPGLLHVILNHGVALSAEVGLVDDAYRAAFRLRDEAYSLGGAELHARRHLTLGVVLAEKDKFAEAMSAIDHTVEGMPTTLIMVHAFTALARMSVYERAGDLDSAYQCARVLRNITKPHNLNWHGGHAERVLARCEGRQWNHFEGENSVF